MLQVQAQLLKPLRTMMKTTVKVEEMVVQVLQTVETASLLSVMILQTNLALYTTDQFLVELSSLLETHKLLLYQPV